MKTTFAAITAVILVLCATRRRTISVDDELATMRKLSSKAMGIAWSRAPGVHQ